ncbi:MAG: Lrp/AsnC ligand binding domain-containing protein [Candidatus Dormibacteraeota bacterium]|jgi:DNA-binding Lrp family transcriptional regulator|nr:Lrp/AsnC ligand binding domain-containing protein [Candidatus Dormibacteraeota bacterium]
MITAFLLVNADRESLGNVGPKLAACPGVIETYTTTGDVDFIAKVHLTDLEALAELVQSHLTKIDGITSTRTHLAMRRYNLDEISAAYDLGVD